MHSENINTRESYLNWRNYIKYQTTMVRKKKKVKSTWKKQSLDLVVGKGDEIRKVDVHS